MGKPTGIAFNILLAVCAAGLLGLVWIAGYVLYWDGVMVEELTICAVLIAVLAAIGGGAWALRARGKIAAALALLAVGALPTAAVGGLFVYLEYNPIVWR